MWLRKISLISIMICLLTGTIPISSVQVAQNNDIPLYLNHESESKKIVERYLPLSVAKKLRVNDLFAAGIILYDTVDLSLIDRKLDSEIKPTIRAISWDGSVIVGQTESVPDPISDYISRAFIWTKDRGLRYLNETQARDDSCVSAMNWDGTVAVGHINTDQIDKSNAFIWTSTQGLVILGNLNGGFYGKATAVNNDGSIIAGYVKNGLSESDNQLACIWNKNRDIEVIGSLLGVNKGYSTANAVSGDGKVIVGTSSYKADSCRETHAFIWTKSKGMKSLGTLDGNDNSCANAVNWDGSIVVGSSYGNYPNNFHSRAFIWTEKAGIRRLNNQYRKHASYVTAISYDGKRILGWISTDKYIKGKKILVHEAVIWQVMPDNTIKTYSLKKILMTKHHLLHNYNFDSYSDNCMNILGNIIVGKHVNEYGPHERGQDSWLAHIPRSDYLSEQNKAIDNNLIEFEW